MRSQQLIIPPDALKHSQQLVTIIKQKIVQAGGRISFAQFMELALYAPQLGYYMNPQEKLGIRGDFITAPELSPLFGQCLAQQCRQVLEVIPTGDIIEFGPGSGILASHILTELSRVNCLPRHYYLIELSASLRQQQKNTIAKLPTSLASKVVWLDHFPLTAPCSGIIIANEVVDAMPVHRFAIKDDSVKEMFIYEQQGQLHFRYENSANSRLINYISGLQQSVLKDIKKYESEVNLKIEPWIQAVADSLAQGVLLVIDYGFARQEYYHPERAKGTLMCHYRHHSLTDPLLLPGLMDITSHVDFTHVAEAGHLAGLRVAGYASQAFFLLSCGLLEFAQEADLADDNTQRVNRNTAIKRLTHPTEMGEMIKVIALTKGLAELTLKGYTLQNLVHKF